MATFESRLLWFVVALLVSVIAGVAVGLLSHDTNDSRGVRKAVLRGLLAFGGALVGMVTIEYDLGVL
jgi:hypothetical protein